MIGGECMNFAHAENINKSHAYGIICFGDSVIFGTGAANRNSGCGRILRSLIDVPVLIKGINNATTREGLKRIKQDVLGKTSYSYVIILFGNNDCGLIDIDKPCVDIEEYKNNITEMINLIKKDNKIPLISNLQPITNEGFLKGFPKMKDFLKSIKSPYEWHKKYSDSVGEIAQSTNIRLIDINTSLSNFQSGVLSSDGLHPNNLGHKIIAEEFKKALLNI